MRRALLGVLLIALLAIGPSAGAGVAVGAAPAAALDKGIAGGGDPLLRRGLTTIAGRTELGVVSNAVSRAYAAPDAPLFADLLAGSGARWAREEFRWDLIEPERGLWDWAAHDEAVARFRGAGFDIIGLLAYSTDWAVGDTIVSSPLPPPREEWARYVTATVERYRHSVAVWEVWNEPDSRAYWRGDARSFAAFLTYTAGIIRAADPGATIISGGVSNVGTGLPFLEAVGAHGGLAAIDGIGVHPYLAYSSLLGGAYRDTEVARLRALQERFDRPLWITEFGFSSLIEGGGAAGEAAQAGGIVRQIVETTASPLAVRAMVVYGAADDGVAPARHEQHAGLFRHDGRTPKPAFGALQTLGRVLGDSRAIERTATADPRVARYRFHGPLGGDATTVTDVIWTDGAMRAFALDTVGPARLTTLTGGEHTLTPALGQITIEAGALPVYVTHRPPPAGLRFIAESGHTLGGPFLAEWLASGALAGLGLPLSEPVKHDGVWFQYFERGRLEFDGATRRGLVGLEIARRYDGPTLAPLRCAPPGWRLPRDRDPGDPLLTLPPCPHEGPLLRFFPRTGHTLGGPMLVFWETHGAATRLGEPISEEFARDGLRMQLFERARLEYHPASGAIVLGRVGAEAMEAHRDRWPFWPASPVGTDAGRHYFARTGHSLTPRAARDWARLGGAEVLGAPLSEEYARDSLQVQLFERGRIVWSATGGATLALVGYEHAALQRDRAVRMALAPHFCHPNGAAPDGRTNVSSGGTRPPCEPDARYFAETRHSLGGAFLDFWSQGGALARFGYPISEAFLQDGRLVQYFERARLELSTSGEVRLSPLGVDLARP